MRMTWTLVLIGGGGVMAILFGMKQFGLVRPNKARILLRQRALVVDVRTDAEYRRGHLPGSINLPLSSLPTAIKQRAPKTSQVVLMYCGSGTRSGVGRRMLKQMGYHSVFNLGGYRRAAHILRGSV